MRPIRRPFCLLTGLTTLECPLFKVLPSHCCTMIAHPKAPTPRHSGCIPWTKSVRCCRVLVVYRGITMNKETLDILSALGSIAMPVVTLFGFAFLYVQIKAASQTIESQATAQIYGLGMRMYEMIVAHPELRRHLYETNEVPNDPAEKDRLLMACEMYCDFFEYVIAEGRTIGGDVRGAWIAMMKEMVGRSLALRIFIDERRSQYTKPFLGIFDQAQRRVESCVLDE
jgi:hypothetical protein